MSAGGGCEAAVTVRTRCGLVKLSSMVSRCMAVDFLQGRKRLFIGVS